MYDASSYISMKDFRGMRSISFLEAKNRACGKGSARICFQENNCHAFYEPSTDANVIWDRHEAPWGEVIDLGPIESSSIAKREICRHDPGIGNYSDAIVLRHPREGAARMASEFSKVPIINAGMAQDITDADNAWPIYEYAREQPFRLRIALVGDLNTDGQSIHWHNALSLYQADVTLVSRHP